MAGCNAHLSLGVTCGRSQAVFPNKFGMKRHHQAPAFALSNAGALKRITWPIPITKDCSAPSIDTSVLMRLGVWDSIRL